MTPLITDHPNCAMQCPADSAFCFAVALNYYPGKYALVSTMVHTFEQALEYTPFVQPSYEDTLCIIRASAVVDVPSVWAKWDSAHNRWKVCR